MLLPQKKFDPNKQFVNIQLDSRYLRFHGLLQMALGLGFLASQSSILPLPAAIAGTALMSSFGIKNYARHLKIQKRIADLSKPNKAFVTLDWINEHRQTPGTFYLGNGYEWGTECTQIYHQLANVPNLKDLVDVEPDGGGKVFMHNIGQERAEPKYFELPEHTIVAGTTGVGKTRTLELLISQMIDQGDSAVIVIDPKGDKDLLNRVYSLAEKNGKADSFQFFSLLHPNNSGTWDLFGDCTKGSEVADRITSIIAESGGGANTADPFVAFCWSLIEATAQLMLVMEEKVTPKRLYQYLCVDSDPIFLRAQNRLAHLKGIKEKEVLQEALDKYRKKIVEHSIEHKDKMTATLIPVLTILGTGEIGGLLSPEVANMNIADIINNKRIVYIFLGAMAAGRESATIGKLIVQNIVGHIGRDYASKHVLNSFYLIVDEFYSVAFPGYIEMLGKARAAGLKMFLGMQTSSDIASALGEVGVQQVITNTTNYICHRIPEKFFSETISEQYGTTSVPKKTITRGTSAGMDKADNLFRSSTAERLDMSEVPRVSPEMLTSLPRGEIFIITQGYAPIKIAVPLVENDLLPGQTFFDRLNPEIPLNMDGIDLFGQEDGFTGLDILNDNHIKDDLTSIL